MCYSVVFVCVAALAILDKLDEVDEQTLAWWLAERQLPSGGLNGRPEKKEDARILSCLTDRFVLILDEPPCQVCYSFWVLSSLSILNKVPWIDAEKLTSFILSAQVSRDVFALCFYIHPQAISQDPENGGIADRPGDMADVFHTVFGVAGEFS